MSRASQNWKSLLITVALVALNLVALNYLVSGWSTARVDLTEEGVYSISPSTKRILTSLDEELTVYGYFSNRTHPKLSPLVPEIRDLLDEYRAISRGKVHVEILDPSENDEVAQEAADRYGVRSTPFQLTSKYESGIVNAYFALVVKYGDQYERYGFGDLIQVDPLPNNDVDVRLRNLEYDLTRAIKKVVYGFRSTNELFERIDDPVRLTGVFSEASLPELFVDVPAAMRTAAGELSASGGDKFEYVELDPLADEAARMEVEGLGLPPLTLGLFGGDNFYLYGILQIGDTYEQLPLAGENVTAASIREAIEAALRRQTPGFLKTVGIYTSSPPEIPPQVRMQMNLPPQPPPEFEEVKRFLREDYTVRDVALGTAAGVPADIDVLLVLKPSGLTDKDVFTIDQYLMRGGRVIVCGGNFAADFGQGGLSVQPVTSGLDDWLAHNGVTIEPTLILDDRNQALPIPETRATPLGNMRTWVMAPYPYLVQVVADGFANAKVTASLDAVGIYWGSPLTVAETSEDIEVLPILRSSDLSWTDDDTSKVGHVEYTVPEATEPHLLAVALSGAFGSYYADREVPFQTSPENVSPAPDDPDTAEVAETPEPTPTTVALSRSPDTRLVVVGNAAFLSDLVARTISQSDGGFFVENLRFIENTIDWVSLDSDMLAIRTRGLASRRLASPGKGAQVTIEVLAYAVPIALLIALGLNVYWRRKNTVPIVGAPARPATSGAASQEPSVRETR